jgi:hypothetical protein
MVVAHNPAIATAPNPIQSRRELERGDGLQASLASVGFCSRLFGLSIVQKRDCIVAFDG